MRTLLTLIALSILAFGCSKTDEGSGDDTASQKADEGKADEGKSDEGKADEGTADEGDTYEARGEIKGIDEATGQLAIHHESIPEFKNREGKKTGMMAMQMSFRTADSVDRESLAVGDKIEFEFAVEWDEAPPIVVTGVKKLPADTELEL